MPSAVATRPPLARSLIVATVTTLAACASAGTSSTPADLRATVGLPGASTASVLSAARRSGCFVADTTAPGADTLIVVDPHPFVAGAIDLGCGMNKTLAPPPTPANVLYAFPAPGTDVRDVLDAGFPGSAGRRPDVVLTRDPEVLAYGVQTGNYLGYALPWDRTYVLAVAGADSAAMAPTVGARDSQARDAVSADARGATPPFWWLGDSTCTMAIANVRAARVVAYPAGDPIARQLAERIAALASSPSAPPWLPSPLTGGTPTPVRVSAVTPDSLLPALASGRAMAAVYAYPIVQPPSCHGAPPVPTGGVVLPLIDSRPHALVRLGSGAAFYVTRTGSLWYTKRSSR
jgi:hypothetical protein